MIYFVRHGLDDESFIGGWSSLNLIKEGRSQMKETAKFLFNLNIKPKYIYSSDVKRAIESAEIIKKRFNSKIIALSIFRELNKGKLNGMLKRNAVMKYPEFGEGFDDIHKRYPEGESLIDFYNRIKNELYPKLKDFDESIIVAHRGVINMLYFILNNKEPDYDKKQFGVTHGSVHELNLETKVIKKIK